MHKYLIWLYNSVPLKFLSDMKVSFYFHPGNWRLELTKTYLDLGPLSFVYGYSKLDWNYDLIYGLRRSFSKEDIELLENALKELENGVYKK